MTHNVPHRRRCHLLLTMDRDALCVPRMGIADDRSGLPNKDSQSRESFTPGGCKFPPHAKVSMRVASRQGFRREAGSEVSGTAKAGMHG